MSKCNCGHEFSVHIPPDEESLGFPTDQAFCSECYRLGYNVECDEWADLVERNSAYEMRKPSKAQIETLKMIAKLSPEAARGTASYSRSVGKILKLRAHGLIEPLESWQAPTSWSAITEKGRHFLQTLDENKTA